MRGGLRRGVEPRALQSGQGLVLPNAQEQVHEKADLELVTWLVIKQDNI